MNRAHHSRTDPICQSASQKRRLRIDRGRRIRYNRTDKAPEGARGPERAGRENREAGERPARDRRRMGERRFISHCGEGPHGKADRRLGTRAGRPACWRILPREGRHSRVVGPIIWGEFGAAGKAGTVLCCLTPLFRMSGERCFSCRGKKEGKTDENPQEVPCSPAGHDPDRGPDCVLRRNGQPERPVRLQPAGPVRLQQPHPGGERLPLHPDHQGRPGGDLHPRPRDYHLLQPQRRR